MKKILNKKILISFTFLIIFSVLFVSKASAEILINNSTGPADNTITALDVNSNINSVNFTVDFQVLCTDPTAVDNIWFQPYIDGVKEPPTILGARYIWNGKVADYCNKNLKLSFSDGVLHARDAKVYSWKLTDSTGKIEYVNKSFKYKINTVDSGFYYIFKQQSGSVSNPVYVFEYSSKFNDLTSCTTESKNLSTKDIKSTLYRDCQAYSSLPDLTTSEFTPIYNVDPKAINTTDNSSVYKLLAPIGNITTMNSAGCATGDKTCITNDIGVYLNFIFKFAIGLCAALAVIMLIISGVTYMGDESVFGKTAAKEKMFNAILGLIIALGAYALLNTINPALTGKSGLTIDSANVEVETQPLTKNDTLIEGTKTTSCTDGIVTANTANGGIPVCASLKDKIVSMISKAKEAGINLFGFGYRSKATQEALRSQNCGGSANINNSSAKCTPTTAMPGTSRHENGLAIDFTCDGITIKSTDNKCFIWLKANASAYGYNNGIVSEPWHWSTDGH